MKSLENCFAVLFSVVLIAALVAVPVTVYGSKSVSDAMNASRSDEVEYVPDELIVWFKDDAAKEQIDEAILKLDAHVKKGPGPTSPWKIYLLKIGHGRSVWEAIDFFKRQPIVRFGEPNFVLRLEGANQRYPNDSGLRSQWSLLNAGQTMGVIDADTDLPQAFSIFDQYNLWRNGDPVVAIIDSGVDLGHPDIAANLWTNPQEDPMMGGVAGVDDDGNGYVDDIHGFDFVEGVQDPARGGAWVDAGPDRVLGTADDNDGPVDFNGHGTHVAGIIGAVGNNGQDIAGVNWNARLMILRASNANGFLELQNILDSINYVGLMRGQGTNVVVVNLSFASRDYAAEEETAIDLASRGPDGLLGTGDDILFTVAAGNDARDLDVGEYIYRDTDNSETITVGDVRLTEVTAFHPGPGHPPQKDATRTYSAGPVAAGDWDALASTPLISFIASEQYWDSDGSGTYTFGEPIYDDNDGNGQVSAAVLHPDFRETYVSVGAVNYPAGSRVAPGDADLGRGLSGFASNERHVDDRHVDGRPGVVDPLHQRERYEGQAAYPASYPLDNIISVASSNDIDHVSDFSNYGKVSVDVAAPGENIVSLGLNFRFLEGEWIYRDADRSTDITLGDTRLASVTMGSHAYAAGGGVLGADLDLDFGLFSFGALERHDEQVPGNNAYDSGEFIYLDIDNSMDVSVGDVRLLSDTPYGSIVGVGDVDVGNNLVAFAANEMHTTVVTMSGTSMAAPHVCGIISLAFALFPTRTPSQVKNDILFATLPLAPSPKASGVDRKPSFGAQYEDPVGVVQYHPIMVADGRIRWPYTGDFYDAPETYNHPITPMEAAALHWDDGNEWFGDDVTNEVDADSPPPYDQDATSNIVVAPPAYDMDGADHPFPPNFWFAPAPPWVLGTIVTVYYRVSTNYFGVLDAHGGRYQNVPSKMIYVNGFIDWNGNGAFTDASDHVISQPHNLAAMPGGAPGTNPRLSPPTTTVLLLSSTFVVPPSVPSSPLGWIRFRLDYGENVGHVNSNPALGVLGFPGFLRDRMWPSLDHSYRAIFGEVEDFPSSYIYAYEGREIISNGIYDVAVTTAADFAGIGTFTIATGVNHPRPFEDVLYGGAWGYPATTYITIHVTDTQRDYVTSSDTLITPDPGYTLVNLDSTDPTVILAPKAVSVSWLTFENLLVTQTVEVLGSTLDDAIVQITMWVRNLDIVTHDVDVRFEFDLMIDGWDGSWIRTWAAGSPGPWLNTETEWDPPSFDFWETTNYPFAPVFYVLGSWTTAPHQMIFAHWASSYGQAYSYAPSGIVIGADEPGVGGQYDSAVLYYFGTPIAPGETRMVTAGGVSALVPDVAITGVTPSRTLAAQGSAFSIDVTVQNQGVIPQTFNVTAYVTNVGIANGLVGHWRFDEGSGTTAGDSSGKGNAGTLANGPSWIDGRFGKALSFDGVDDFVSVPDTASWDFEGNDFSIGLWIRFNSVTGVQSIMGQSNGGGVQDKWAIEFNFPTANKITFHMNGATIKDITADWVPSPGTWYYVAFTRENDLWKFFINGVNISTETFVGTVPDSASTLKMGTDGELWRYFNGAMDDVKIFGRALSAYEVLTQYASGPLGGLAGYWSLDEGRTTTAYDASGNGNHGTLINGPTWVDGKYGKALSFDGVDDYVEVPDSASLDITNQITISGWLFRSEEGYVVLAEKWNVYGFRIGTSTLDGYVSIGGNPTAGELVTPLTFSTGMWYYVAYTFDGYQAKIYVNGNLLASKVCPGNIDASNLPLFIGANGGGSFTKGIIDDVRIYNRALSADEIMAIYLSASFVIQTRIVTNLPPNTSTTLAFTWNTTDFAYGSYNISAYASPISGEMEIADNTQIGGIVRVVIPGDVNADGVVDILDVSGISAHWSGPPSGPLGYDPSFDINNDGAIDILEISIISAHWTGPPKGPLAP